MNPNSTSSSTASAKPSKMAGKPTLSKDHPESAEPDLFPKDLKPPSIETRDFPLEPARLDPMSKYLLLLVVGIEILLFIPFVTELILYHVVRPEVIYPAPMVSLPVAIFGGNAALKQISSMIHR